MCCSMNDPVERTGRQGYAGRKASWRVRGRTAACGTVELGDGDWLWGSFR